VTAQQLHLCTAWKRMRASRDTNGRANYQDLCLTVGPEWWKCKQPPGPPCNVGDEALPAQQALTTVTAVLLLLRRCSFYNTQATAQATLRCTLTTCIWCFNFNNTTDAAVIQPCNV
jgi:hypothetical protein